MRISNRVKRNVCAVLAATGLFCMAGQAIDLAMDLKSVIGWVRMVMYTVMTTWIWDDCRKYHRRVKRGILFGSTKDC